MDLVGRLSNQDGMALLQRLMRFDWKQARRQYRLSRGVAPDGRRPVGSVGGAIVQVLAEAESTMRVRDIHAAVERLLGSPVASGSVKNYLHKRSQGHNRQFENMGYRKGYCLSTSLGPRR